MTYPSIQELWSLTDPERITAKASSIAEGKTRGDRRKPEGLVRRKDEIRTHFSVFEEMKNEW